MRSFEIEIHPIKWLYYNLPGQENCAALIASSYDIRQDKLKLLTSVLALKFADVTDSRNPQAFRPEQAEEIYRYIGSLPTDVKKLFVCCESGESRSAAITAALIRYFNEDDLHIWQNPHLHPNPLVYSVMCEKQGRTVTAAELEERIKINNDALINAIENKRRPEPTADVIDIHSKGDYPSCELSNFYPHAFELDGVRCSSMEGFLQSLKFRSVNKQKKVCLLTGKEAKNSTRHSLAQLRWRLTQTLYWQGKAYKRNSGEYRLLLDRAYNALSENADFITALRASATAGLVHTIGSQDPRKTVLTEEEFISRLDNIRKNMR